MIVVVVGLVASLSFLLGHGNQLESVQLEKCGDGDTAHFKIEGTVEKVRFIAVDTPELTSNDFYAKEAMQFTCSTLEKAKRIEIEIDPKAKERDKFGRMIAWIYVDGTLLQEQLVKYGYARVHYIYDDYMHLDSLRTLEKEAKRNNVGMWK